jgi:16S rRNA (cytidine1402-2'-O)-methyltransferase
MTGEDRTSAGEERSANYETVEEPGPESLEADQPETRSLEPGLYLVATPIGNLEDITLRALRVLKNVDRIACEDTRQTQKLLNHFGIRTPTVSCHEHNEQARIGELLEVLTRGGRVAVVSDAGMPGISDPGMRVARAAIEAGIKIIPIPGANAALTGLVASGLDTERFLFGGFLSARAGARRAELAEIQGAQRMAEKVTLVFYEAPHRILETLEDIARIWGPSVRVAVARELTKRHEELLRGTAAEVRAALAERERIRGEMVLLVEAHSSAVPAVASASVADRVGELMRSEGLDQKDALKRVAKERGLSKSEVYRELHQARR